MVRNGRLVLDEPTSLPEGKIVELEEADPYSDELELNAEQRTRVDDAIDRGLSDARAGRSSPASEFIDELDRK
jgi:hypothetical protein